MIYQHVSKKTKILPLATSHIAHLCNLFNHVCTTISMPYFKSINFYQNIPKIFSFCKKCKIFGVLGAPPQTTVPPEPQPPAAMGFKKSEKFSNCEFLATHLVFLLLLCYFV